MEVLLIRLSRILKQLCHGEQLCASQQAAGCQGDTATCTAMPAAQGWVSPLRRPSRPSLPRQSGCQPPPVEVKAPSLRASIFLSSTPGTRIFLPTKLLRMNPGEGVPHASAPLAEHQHQEERQMSSVPRWQPQPNQIARAGSQGGEDGLDCAVQPMALWRFAFPHSYSPQIPRCV